MTQQGSKDSARANENDAHLMVSRRGIVHVVRSLAEEAVTACGKGSRNLVLIGAVGLGERMCHSCARAFPPGSSEGA